MAPVHGARTADQLGSSLAAADLHLPAEAVETLDAATTPTAAPYPYGAFGAAQRDRVANGPEALSTLVQDFASHWDAATSP